MKFYSPLRYPGGKGRLANFLVSSIDELGLDNDTIFVEPYAGGAGAALELLDLGKVKGIIINDLDRAIYSFWQAAILSNHRFIKKVLDVGVTIPEWRRQKAIYKSGKTSGFGLGFATFFLNRTNKSGLLNGGPIGGMDQKGKWKIDARFNKAGLVERLERIGECKKQIKVSNKDGVELLEKLATHKKHIKYFVFLDPPYIKQGSSLYLNHYKAEDHKRLAVFLRKTPLNWIMTYDETRQVRILHAKQRITGFRINHTARSFRVGKEVLIHPPRLKITGALELL